jgi:predicted Fe-Mo cluster-binding NifX family protein
MTMKIAVPVAGEKIDAHFGHCEAYLVYETSNGLVESTYKVDSPHGCGCRSNIASILAGQGVSLMIAGNMGEGAYQILNRHGIEVIRGCSGDSAKAVEDYLHGLLIDNNKHCEAHHSHHGQHEHSNHECGQH